jgi:hypothetical protein
MTLIKFLSLSKFLQYQCATGRHSMQTDEEFAMASHPLGVGNSFSRGKGPEREADHLHISSVEVKNEHNCTSPAPMCLYGVISCYAQRHIGVYHARIRSQ